MWDEQALPLNSLIQEAQSLGMGIKLIPSPSLPHLLFEPVVLKPGAQDATLSSALWASSAVYLHEPL